MTSPPIPPLVSSFSSSASSSTSQNPPFMMYTTNTHRITKGRYITSNDPRGYVPVYEYPLHGQWIMMDIDDGYVLWTGIWKALGNNKADIVKMVESQPDLASQIRRVRGGYLKIQGSWMPYEVALRLARRVAYPIRYDLVPLFGPNFPDTCLTPDQPGYGQVLDNPGRRKRRGPSSLASRNRAPPALQLESPVHTRASSGAPAAYHHLTQHHVLSGSESSAHEAIPFGTADRDSHPRCEPSYPAHAPQNAQLHHAQDLRPISAQSIPFAAHQDPYQYSNPNPAPQHYRSHSPGLVSNRDRDRVMARPNQRYSPYPPASASSRPEYSASRSPQLQHHHYHRTPASSPSSSSQHQHQHQLSRHLHQRSSDSSLRRSGSASEHHLQQQLANFQLPPISSIKYDDQAGNRRHDFSLPPIGSLREGLPPTMDATSVLRRLRLDDSQYIPSPSPAYLQQRRSSSAPPLHLAPSTFTTLSNNSNTSNGSHSVNSETESSTSHVFDDPPSSRMQRSSPGGQPRQGSSPHAQPYWGAALPSPALSLPSHREQGSTADASPVTPHTPWDASESRLHGSGSGSAGGAGGHLAPRAAGLGLGGLSGSPGEWSRERELEAESGDHRHAEQQTPPSPPIPATEVAESKHRSLKRPW